MIVGSIAHNRAAGGLRKMRREDKPPAISMLLEELDTRQPRLIGIHTKARAPCRIAYLQRVVHQVGTHDRFVSLASICSSPIRPACPDLKMGKTLSVM